LCEELEAVVDQGLVEEHAPLAEEVAAVADDLDTTIGVVSIETEEDLMMREDIALLG